MLNTAADGAGNSGVTDSLSSRRIFLGLAVAAAAGVIANAPVRNAISGLLSGTEARAQEGGPPPGAAANNRASVASTGSPTRAFTTAREAAPVASPTGGVAHVGTPAKGAPETAEVPKEWRWYLKEVNGEFYVVLKPTEKGEIHYQIEIKKSHRIDSDSAPNGTLNKKFPTDENSATDVVYEILAKWGNRSFKDQKELLTEGLLVRTKRIVFKRVTGK